MSQLPNHKVPRLGTTGEKYRERNLVHQLPAQDLALTHCRHVAAEQQRAFRDFVQARNDIALDVGFVRELSHSSVSGSWCEEGECVRISHSSVSDVVVSI